MAARDDAIEIAQVGGEVEGEAVADHGPVQLDPNRRHLLAARPDAGQATLARRGDDPDLGQVVDQRALEPLQVLGDGEAEMRKVEDGVADQLPGAVVCRLATAIRPDHVHASPRAFVRIPQQVVGGRGLAHREHVRVLQEQQRVRRAPIAHRGHQLALEVPGLAVGDATQPAGSYAPGLAHQRDMRNGQGDRLRHGRSPCPSPSSSARRIPRAGSSERPRHASCSAAGTGRR